jgi:hypothetical protein
LVTGGIAKCAVIRCCATSAAQAPPLPIDLSPAALNQMSGELGALSLLCQVLPIHAPRLGRWSPMAIYRFEAKVIARSQGRSATASAAYRAAESIEDERTGAVFDYTRKRGVLYSEIITPPNTPAWMEDRAQLWNAVEKAEKRRDAQLARDLLLSLPHELTHEQRRELVREFVTAEFVAQGMIADVAIHAPDRQADERNHHVHILLTMRAITADGFGNKVREWNATNQLEAWREHWADAVNRHLDQHGHEARVDHRSLADQGIDREPEPKQGPVATEMEREGRSSHAGDDRRAAHARNEDRAALEAELKAVAAEIFDLEQERAKRVGQGTMSENPPNETAEQQRRARAQQEEDARQSRAREEEQTRQQDAHKAAEQRIEALARENADIQVRQAEEMREQRARLDAFESAQKRQVEQIREEDERKRQAQERGKAAEGEIREAGDRYRVALGENYDVRDPYGSLARAAMAEYADFIRDRERLTQQIAKEQDPEARQALQLRKEIEVNDYMAITSHRIAKQSEDITGRRDSEEAIRFRERAADHQAQSKELRQEYRDLATERAARAADPKEQQQEAQTANNQSTRPTENTAAKEAETRDREQTNDELTDAKAERIAKIREQARQFNIAEKARQTSRDRGGRS